MLLLKETLVAIQLGNRSPAVWPGSSRGPLFRLNTARMQPRREEADSSTDTAVGYAMDLGRLVPERLNLVLTREARKRMLRGKLVCRYRRLKLEADTGLAEEENQSEVLAEARILLEQALGEQKKSCISRNLLLHYC
ncbi:unnamed protein product [Protopolystoma xenopodis]|uniref:Uncharacterized protein n=1 Tax=Protopolystoma xenopodis TaxID=117903 RepID=A0A448WMR5_9PLAT|nr:unnamed protein product [Protopolystoma xenopodis]